MILRPTLSTGILALLLSTTCRGLPLNNRTESLGKRVGPASPIFSQTIVAIGDLHGLSVPDFQKLLVAADVIDDRGSWTGNVNILVQTGDIVDRYILLAPFHRKNGGTDCFSMPSSGPWGFQLYDYMEILRAKAAMAGGLVVSLYGNHEFMNFYGMCHAPNMLVEYSLRPRLWTFQAIGSTSPSWK